MRRRHSDTNMIRGDPQADRPYRAGREFRRPFGMTWPPTSFRVAYTEQFVGQGRLHRDDPGSPYLTAMLVVTLRADLSTIAW